MSEYWAGYVPTAIWFVLSAFLVWGWFNRAARLRKRAEAFASAQNEVFMQAYNRQTVAMERIAEALEAGNRPARTAPG